MNKSTEIQNNLQFSNKDIKCSICCVSRDRTHRPGGNMGFGSDACDFLSQLPHLQRLAIHEAPGADGEGGGAGRPRQN